jgi:predicted RNA-binding Zn-ribbon protein involved in translation (DUF1610 family)
MNRYTESESNNKEIDMKYTQTVKYSCDICGEKLKEEQCLLNIIKRCDKCLYKPETRKRESYMN